MNYLRPDEREAQSNIERSKKTDSRLKTGAKVALDVGLAATGASVAPKAFGALSSRVLPFLSEYIPVDLALKGINKVSPELGKLLDSGMKKGLDVKEGFDFIRSQLQDFQGEVDNLGKEPAKQNRSIIEQYSPNIHKYIEGLIKQGNTPSQAALKSQKFLDKKELDIIKKIEKDHKSDWTSIVESIFGGGQASQQTNPSILQDPNSMPQGQPSPEMQAQTTQQPQQGQGQQALMQMLQQINQRMGKR